MKKFISSQLWYLLLIIGTGMREGLQASAFTGFEGVQEIVVSGTVSDHEGLPLIGVSIRVKGASNGVATDFDGEFMLSGVKEDAVLIVSYVGFKTEEIAVEGRTEISITMKEDTQALEGVVVVGYGTQKKINVTGAVSTIDAKTLSKTPLASTSNLLTGRLPGLITVQNSGQPGADAASLNIRGFGTPLIIVDGVQTEFNNLDANQIESISILKDGAASVYGARAGNGVILVTTKRGNLGKPVITLNTSTTWQGVTNMPRPVNAGQYAEMEREEWIQSGKPIETAPYTEEEIQKFYDGTDPQYPDTDWYDVLTRDWAPQQQHNLSVRGGSERIKYFGLIGYLDQQTMWTRSGGSYKRYNLQSNIDAKISDNLSIRFDVSGKIEDRNFSNRGWGSGSLNSIWGDLWVTSPTEPASHPDPDKLPNAHIGNAINSANLTSSRDIWGYNDNDTEQFSATLSLKYQIKPIKGLSFRAFGNYMKNNSRSKTFNKSFETYDYDYAADTYTQVGSRSNRALNIRKSDGRLLTGQFSLNYDNTFSKQHHVTALAMYELIDRNSDWIQSGRMGFLTNEIDQIFAGSRNDMRSDGAASEMGRASYIGRVTYSFREKYLFEATIRADASAKFNADSRWGYFPGVSAGWRITEEPFMKSVSFLDELKLRASYGRSGFDDVGNFQYLSGYSFNDTYIFEGENVEQGILTTGLANPLLTWEEMAVSNIGLDFKLFNGNLYGETEYFYRTRTGIPATRVETLPSSFGADLPQENINSLTNRGFELMLGTKGNTGGFFWEVSGNISWSRQKWDYFEEPEYTDLDQQRVEQKSGRWTDLVFGYKSEGLFTSMEEIERLPFDQDQQGNQTLRPGDVKYVDVNEDGILDWRDKVEIGKVGRPRWMFGFETNLSYKNFDLSALLQGAFDHYAEVNLNARNAVPPLARYNLRWTEENNNPDALEPRVGGSPLNNVMSDYRLKPADYMRLKVLSIGYNFPEELIGRAGITKLRIYLSGTNLFTLSKLDKFDLDPEMPSGMVGLYYPQQRTISMGLNLSL